MSQLRAKISYSLFIVLATMQMDMMVEKRRMDQKKGTKKKNKMSVGARMST